MTTRRCGRWIAEKPTSCEPFKHRGQTGRSGVPVLELCRRCKVDGRRAEAVQPGGCAAKGGAAALLEPCAASQPRHSLVPAAAGRSRRVPACRAGCGATVATCAFSSLVPHPRPRSIFPCFPVPRLLPLDCVLPLPLLLRGVLSCPHHIPIRHVLSAPPSCLHAANVWVNSFSVLNSSRSYSTSILCANSRSALASSSPHLSLPALGRPWSQRTPPGCIIDVDEHPLARMCGPPCNLLPRTLFSTALASTRLRSDTGFRPPVSDSATLSVSSTSWTMLDAADMSYIVHPVYLLSMGFITARALFKSSASLLWCGSVTETRGC
jgi:hypothetical protein